jgi:hypothetical protein
MLTELLAEERAAREHEARLEAEREATWRKIVTGRLQDALPAGLWEELGVEVADVQGTRGVYGVEGVGVVEDVPLRCKARHVYATGATALYVLAEAVNRHFASKLQECERYEGQATLVTPFTKAERLENGRAVAQAICDALEQQAAFVPRVP